MMQYKMEIQRENATRLKQKQKQPTCLVQYLKSSEIPIRKEPGALQPGGTSRERPPLSLVPIICASDNGGTQRRSSLNDLNDQAAAFR